ncbi:MAG: phosphatase PAP2 family protein [Clostridia bacterium]|nr:phosphatase PAP2 family protein [Clostridia bacterium]
MSKSFYQKLYLSLTEPLRPHKRAVKALVFAEKVLVGVSMAAYAALVFYAFFRLGVSWQNAAATLLLPAVCLFLVSFFRKIFKRPRPYEQEGAKIFPLVEKNAFQNSFPSRHTACAFVIASVTLAYFPLAGGVLYAVGVWIAFFRFLFGHHYFTDLLGGATLGLLVGLPALLLI